MIRVGVVGLRRGQGVLAALTTHPDVEVVAICDLDAGVLSDLGDGIGIVEAMRFRTYDELLDSAVDAIAIATPIAFHAEQTVAALEAGKHVLCEQTMAYTVADCERIVEAESRSGCVYMMIENYTYFHFIRQWKELVDQGRIGEITYAEGEYLHEILDLLVDPETGERRWRYARPPIWYCAHTLGPLLMLMDDQIVRATGLQSGHRSNDEEGEGFIDMEVALFQTAKGAMIKILRSQVVPRYPHLIWYCLLGTKGYLESSRSYRHPGLHYSADEHTPDSGAVDTLSEFSDPDAPAAAHHEGAHGTSEYLLVRDFVEAIQQGRRAPVDSIRAAQITLPGLIAHESAKAGGVWLDVPQLG
jgi:predicted dehydrogenase